MVAVDSSTLIAFLQGDEGPDVDRLAASLAAGEATLPPVVLAEILSEPQLPAAHRATLLGMPTLDVLDGYWARAAATRAALLAKKLRARLPDALIAQSCIDHKAPLIARDGDFRRFSEHCGLEFA